MRKNPTDDNMKVNQMLESPDKDFKVTIIKTIQQGIINSLERN